VVHPLKRAKPLDFLTVKNLARIVKHHRGTENLIGLSKRRHPLGGVHLDSQEIARLQLVGAYHDLAQMDPNAVSNESGFRAEFGAKVSLEAQREADSIGGLNKRDEQSIAGRANLICAGEFPEDASDHLVMLLNEPDPLDFSELSFQLR
jgi:hypothetical protein